MSIIAFCKNTSIIRLKALVISRCGLKEGSIASASAAGSDVLNPELARVDSESSFDEDQETTEERETTKMSSEAPLFMDRLFESA